MTPAELEQYARALAEQQGLNPDFVSAIGHAESGFKPDAVSSAGAIGPMQLMPATAKDLGVNPSDPYDNIRGGVTYLKQLHDQFGGDQTLMAAAYNAGPGAVRKAGGVPNFPETQKYVQKVTAASAIDPSQVEINMDAIDPSQVQIDPTQVKVNAPTQNAAEEMSAGQAALAAGGGFLDRLAAGAKQKTRALLGDNAVNAIDALGSKLGMADSSQLESSQAGNQIASQQLSSAHPVASFAGELPLAFAAKTPIGMAAMGALEYGTPQESALRAAGGYLGGKSGELIGKAIGRVVNPFRAANPVAQAETNGLAARYGVNLTPAEATGSKALGGLEGTLAQLPGSAGVMSKVQQGQREAFNRAAMATLGESGTIGNDAAILAQKNIGNRLQTAAQGVNIPIDDALLGDLAKVESKYTKNLTPDQRPIVSQYMNDILGQGDSFGGDAYQAWRSRIGARAAGTSDSELKGALKGIQGALDSAFNRAAPADASAAMTQARGQYRNFKTLEPLINKASMSSSNIPPAQVLNRALATGNTQGEMGGLAQLGQSMGREYPNSGTAPRMFWQRLMTQPGSFMAPDMMLGATGIPLLTAKLLTTGPGEAYLKKGLLSITPAREKLLMKSLGGPAGLLGLLATQ